MVSFFILTTMSIQEITQKALQNTPLTTDEIQHLTTCSLDDLTLAAQEITQTLHDSLFDLCSIINAKSGKCSEDCKWCAQSAHFKTKIDAYALVSTEKCLQEAKYNEAQGIHRFSLVTSGKKLNSQDLARVTQTYQTLRRETKLHLCGSFGLMNEQELSTLYQAGVRRYHCNLETSPSYFSKLCSTHTQDQKIATIQAAKAVGMDVCSGGIIGMGETLWDRCMLAHTLRGLDVLSIPINILMPIPGTPLADSEPLSQEEILQTIALFRIINPKAKLRFSGGRTKLSRESQEKALQMGVNAAIVGDLLTTIGSCVKDDLELFEKAGFECTPKSKTENQ